jgi:hypothetical protein
MTADETGGAPTIPGTRPTYSGPGRLLVAAYGLLALAATARGVFQLTDHGDEAPLAYALSVLSGLIYGVATFALATDRRRLAWVAVLVEMAGVLVVGAASLAWPQDFPDETVWSHFGQGYGWVPLVLPFLGVWWLVRTRARDGQ